MFLFYALFVIASLLSTNVVLRNNLRILGFSRMESGEQAEGGRGKVYVHALMRGAEDLGEAVRSKLLLCSERGRRQPRTGWSRDSRKLHSNCTYVYLIVSMTISSVVGVNYGDRSSDI